MHVCAGVCEQGYASRGACSQSQASHTDSPRLPGMCSLHLPRGPWALRSLSGCPLLPSPKQHQQQLRATAPRGRPPPSCLPAAGTSPPGLLLAAASRCVSRAPNTSPQGSVSGQLLLRKASLPFDAKTPIQGVLLSLPQRDQPGGPEWGGEGLVWERKEAQEARSSQRWSRAPEPTLTLFPVGVDLSGCPEGKDPRGPHAPAQGLSSPGEHTGKPPALTSPYRMPFSFPGSWFSPPCPFSWHKEVPVPAPLSTAQAGPALGPHRSPPPLSHSLTSIIVFHNK